jgi:hypothetical protein
MAGRSFEIDTTNSSTIVSPAPIELMRPFLTGLDPGDKKNAGSE